MKIELEFTDDDAKLLTKFVEWTAGSVTRLPKAFLPKEISSNFENLTKVVASLKEQLVKATSSKN